MRCSAATMQLQLYIDNRLSLDQMRALEKHLALCAACRNELLLLEEVTSAIGDLKPVAEPANLTANIMRRVALSSQQRKKQFSLLRPSLLEWMAVVLLATVTTLGIFWEQPYFWAVLPFTNEQDSLSHAFFRILNTLVSGNPGSLILVLWVGGTLIGICITLALAGNEIRREWFKAMMERLPVR